MIQNEGIAKNWGRGAVVVMLAVLLCGPFGCGEPLQHGLDESEANAMVKSLSQQGIEATKVRDPVDDDRWAVEVSSDRRVEAWSILEREGFPKPDTGGFDDFYPGRGLIPTANEERVVLQYATARELEASLLSINGIIDADVHLVLPGQSQVRMPDEKRREPRASVLLQWRDDGEQPPLDERAVRKLVSGAVENLRGEAVHVVMASVEPPESVIEDGQPRFARVGPVAVAPESQGMLRAVVAVMGAIIIVLSSGLVYVVLTHSRTGDGGGAE